MPVNVIASPPLPSNGLYQVGSSVSLVCQAQGGHSPLTYSWNSTCTGLCFVLGETASIIRRNAIHSIDSGNHTCSVTDYTGQAGSATVQITLSGNIFLFPLLNVISLCFFSGVSLYLDGTGVIQNNSIVQTTSSNSIGQLQCLSASKSANVGQLLAPDGSDITNDSSIVTIGSITDPGFVSLELQSFLPNNQGVYTCIIPDENGIQQYLHTGIYSGRFNGI